MHDNMVVCVPIVFGPPRARRAGFVANIMARQEERKVRNNKKHCMEGERVDVKRAADPRRADHGLVGLVHDLHACSVTC